MIPKKRLYNAHIQIDDPGAESKDVFHPVQFQRAIADWLAKNKATGVSIYVKEIKEPGV